MGFSYCCVPGCFSTNTGVTGDVMFFSCRVQWETIIRENCALPDWTLPKGSLICEKHFDSEFIGKFHLTNVKMVDRYLVKGAFPTIFDNDRLSREAKSPTFDSEEVELQANVLQISETGQSNNTTGNKQLPNKSSPIGDKLMEITPMESATLNSDIFKINSSEEKQYFDSPEDRVILLNICEVAEPSRFGSELLNSETSNVWNFPIDDKDQLIENCHNQQHVFVKEEIIENQIDFADYSFTDTKHHNENRRDDSLLQESEIKKEKWEYEADLPQNVIIKNEIPEDVQIKTEDENVALENCSVKIEEMPTSFNEASVGPFSRKDMYPLPGNTKSLSRSMCALCELYIEKPLQEHIEEHHQSGIFFSCPYCESGTTKMIRVHMEIRKHKEHFDCICEFCGDKFRGWMNLHAHIDKTHQDKVNNLCSICGFISSSYLSSLSHILIFHNGETLKLNCQHCHFATLNSSLLQLHMDAKHSTSKVPMPHSPQVQVPTKKPRYKFKGMMKKCPLCSLKLKTKLLLKTHMKEHDE